LSRQFHGPRRLGLIRFSIYLGLPSVLAVLILIPQLKNVPWSDALSAAGLLVAVVFGLWSDALGATKRGIKIGVVIPSRAPFHSELRSGLRNGLSGRPAQYIDDYLLRSEAPERLSEFMPCLRRVLAEGPDYVIVACPSLGLANSESVAQLLRPFALSGGGIIFIDNPPTELDSEIPARRIGSIGTDITAGAGLIARYIEQSGIDSEDVLVVGGARDSAPAQERQAVLSAYLPDATFIDPVDGGWTEAFGYRATAEHLSAGHSCRIVVCGNDTMALGACEAIRAGSEDKVAQPNVIGFDGLRRALFAIAERDHPLAATILTPPSAYGEEAAAMILADLGDAWLRRFWKNTIQRDRRAKHIASRLRPCVISITESQLVTSDNIATVSEP
jgi:ABC-type sugar transport system substrate-binding protein